MIVLDILGEEGDSEQKALCGNSTEERKYAKHGKHSCIIFPCQAESQSAESLKELIGIDLWRVKHFRVGKNFSCCEQVLRQLCCLLQP